MNAFCVSWAIVSAGALLVALPQPARGDSGALSLELSAGGSIVSVSAPYAAAPTELGTAWAIGLGASYALTNRFELGANAFFEPPQQFVHNGASIAADPKPFQGSLVERTQRIGATIRVRGFFGLVWQPIIGLDAGWSHRTFSRLDLLDTSGGNPRSFGLQLADASQDALLLAPVVGLRWAGDHFAVGLQPRCELLVGSPFSWAVSLPLTVSWAWYL